MRDFRIHVICNDGSTQYNLTSKETHLAKTTFKDLYSGFYYIDNKDIAWRLFREIL